MMEGKANNKYSNLPAGWEMKRLKDVAINCGDYGANAPALPYKAGDIRYIRITDIDDYGHLISDDKASLDETIAQNYLLKDNDILFARTGDTVGKSLLYKSSMGRSAYAGYLIRFTLDEKQILPDYFDAIAKSDIFEAFKISMKRIGAKPNINSREYGIFRFPMPLNLDEQKGIAKLFTKVDEAIASVQNSIAAAERLKKSLMQNLLTGKMKPDGTFRTPEEFYIDEKFGKVPVGWEVKRIDEISERITDVIDPTKTKEVYDYIGLEHIVPDKFIRCGKGLSNETVALKVKFEKGDLLYGKLRPYLNKVFISDISGVGSTEFIVLRNNDFTNWIYLNFQLQRFLDYTKSMTAGTQHPRASWKDIKHYLVCIPKNEIERKMIEGKLLSLEKFRFSQQELVITHEHLKRSLMQNLLTGKIRVEHFINN